MKYEPKSIGEVIWYKGDEAKVISDPYALHGGLFQDAQMIEGGKIVAFAVDAECQNATTIAYHPARNGC